MLADLKHRGARGLATGFHRGIVVGRTDDGVLVEQQGGGAVIHCDVLRLGPEVPVMEPGDAVVYVVPRETPERGCLIGAIGGAPPHDATPPQHEFRADRLLLEGREEIVLRTRRASIVLRANGDIEVLGARIVSRARALIKLLAPMLRLN